MSKIFIDSNILIYNQDKDSPFYDYAHSLLKKLILKKDTGIINSQIINEVHFHFSKEFDKKQAQKEINMIFSIPNISFLDNLWKVPDIKLMTKLATKYNLKTFDAFHAAFCKRKKIKHIATLDKDFNKISWLKNY